VGAEEDPAREIVEVVGEEEVTETFVAVVVGVAEVTETLVAVAVVMEVDVEEEETTRGVSKELK